MSRSSLCRAAGVSATVLAASVGLYAPAASAARAPTYLTMVGSNTTQEVMGAVTATFNASAVAKSEGASATNVDAQPANPGTLARSDSHCNGGVALRYIQGADPTTNERTAPNGSKDGKAALATSVTNGDSCVSVARSSSPGSSSDAAGTQAYAYAVDAVTWTTAGTTDAPKNLSMTQLEGVYDCRFTNWKQVGGKRAPIIRYFPQNGSGSGSFFSGVLGFDPRILGGINTCRTPAIQIEENEAAEIGKAVRARAVMIFSAGAWVAEANGVDTNLRNGFFLRSINHKPSPVIRLKGGKYGTSPIVKEANVEPSTYKVTNNSSVQGVRNLFNFINTNSVDYAATKSFVGAGSALCTGLDSAIITKYGFKPLARCVEQF